MGERHPLADCSNCPLNDPENTFVPTQFPEGVPTLAVVGEAPGFAEGIYKQPFRGPSGKLLDTVLRHYKYKRREVLLTNVCLCRPPGNATPPKTAANACRPRLLAELASSGVRDVLALGGTASSALVDDGRGVSTLRVGPAKTPTRGLDGSAVERVVPTWHPAYCLRTADAFPSLVSDVGKLKDVRREPWSPPEWTYIDDVANALEFLSDLETRAPVVVVDIEVGVEKDTAFDHPNEYDLLCVGLAYERGKAVVLGESVVKDEGVLHALGRYLRRVKIIAHNGKFDLAGLYPHLGGLELWFDTMLAHYALDERPGTHGLKYLAVEKLGAPKYDDEIKRHIPARGNYADIPREILYKYNAMDVACTWALYEMFQDALDREGLRPVHDFMVAASNQLMYLELNGIAVDRTYSMELEGSYIERMSALESTMDELVNVTTRGEIASINPRSPKQLTAYFAYKGVPTTSTDVDHLHAILGRLDPTSKLAEFTRTLLTYRRVQKLYGTYIKGIRKRLYRGRAHTTYMLHGSTSGRLASRNPNLQNIVRDKPIRRQFAVSKEDNIFIQADFKQAEGRVITTLARDEYLRNIFADTERDLFNELSDGLYGPGNWAKEERVRTKAFFYGLSYGRQAYSIAMEYNMSVRDAERRLRDFMDLIPATAAWQSRTKEQVLGGGSLVTPFGRKRRFFLITQENQKDVLNEALSFLPQSTASDICLSALVRLRPMLRGLGWIRLTIHDALVVECPEKNKEVVSEMLAREMIEAGRRFTDYVPFAVDLTYGKNWGEL